MRSTLAIGLVFLSCTTTLQAQARAQTNAMQWNYLLSRADSLIGSERQTNMSKVNSVVINLRRAWLAVDEDLAQKQKVQSEIRTKLATYFLSHNLVSLGNWYKSASLKQIDARMQSKKREGESFFKNSWKARMDEFGLITIWPTDSKPHGSKVFYFRPDDERYSDALALSGLKPRQEKTVDFDISALEIESGPLITLDW